MQISYICHRKTLAPEVRELISLDRLEGSYPEFTPHTHSETFELILCLKGEVELKLSSEQERIRAGCYRIIPPGAAHTFSVCLEESSTLLCAFTCSCAEHLDCITRAPLHLTDPVKGGFSRLEEEMRMLSQCCGVSGCGKTAFVEPAGTGCGKTAFVEPAGIVYGTEQRLRLLLTDILILALREQKVPLQDIMPGDGKRVSRDALIDRIESYISQHANEPLSVRELAEYFNYSRTRLSVIYRESTGKTLKSRIADEKMQLVLWELRQGKIGGKEAAQRAGFASQRAFERKFRKLTGGTVNRYLADGVNGSTFHSGPQQL